MWTQRAALSQRSLHFLQLSFLLRRGREEPQFRSWNPLSHHFQRRKQVFELWISSEVPKLAHSLTIALSHAEGPSLRGLTPFIPAQWSPSFWEMLDIVPPHISLAAPFLWNLLSRYSMALYPSGLRSGATLPAVSCVQCLGHRAPHSCFPTTFLYTTVVRSMDSRTRLPGSKATHSLWEVGQVV